MKNEIQKIERSLLKTWSEQTDTGLARLSKAYRFFTATDEETGDMIFSKHCKHVADMRHGADGKKDFYYFVQPRLNYNLTRTYAHMIENWDAIVEQIANDYVRDQAHRLASYIVRIKNLSVTDKFGGIVTG